MSVNLRDRLFADTGGIVQNATVQAILVTGGGTDAGTSSVVQATTTTDVNGVWKFTALPDAGAGNWYDVKITNGNQIRWRYGNIQAAISQILLGAVIASPHFTAPVVDSGGLTITTGGLSVAAGNVTTGGHNLPWMLGVEASSAGWTGFTADSAYHTVATFSVTTTGGTVVVLGSSPPMIYSGATGQVFMGYRVDAGADTPATRFGGGLANLSTYPLNADIGALSAGAHTIDIRVNCAAGMGNITWDGGTSALSPLLLEMR